MQLRFFCSTASQSSIRPSTVLNHRGKLYITGMMDADYRNVEGGRPSQPGGFIRPSVSVRKGKRSTRGGVSCFWRREWDCSAHPEPHPSALRAAGPAFGCPDSFQTNPSNRVGSSTNPRPSETKNAPQGGAFRFWRREWDSNPRWYRYHAGFQDRCLKPLGHLSESVLSPASCGIGDAGFASGVLPPQAGPVP